MDQSDLDKFNPYGIIKDYECKSCFNQCYEKDVNEHHLKNGLLNGIYLSFEFHPVCPKCGGCSMKIIVKSWSEGSWDELSNTGKPIRGGMEFRSLGFQWFSTINLS